jgi:hypothetical protein
MFGKNENASENEVDEIIQKFNLQSISQEEKDMLVSMAKDRILVSLSPNGIQQASFEKTLIYQNWMLLSHLSRIDKSLEALANK